MDILVILILPLVVFLSIIYLIYAHFRDANEKANLDKANEQILKANLAKIRRLELMRPNLMRRYEEKKVEGLAELDQWCRKYGVTIHEMEVFLGLANDNTELIDKLQNIEDSINAPRVGFLCGFDI